MRPTPRRGLRRPDGSGRIRHMNPDSNCAYCAEGAPLEVVGAYILYLWTKDA